MASSGDRQRLYDTERTVQQPDAAKGERSTVLAALVVLLIAILTAVQLGFVVSIDSHLDKPAIKGDTTPDIGIVDPAKLEQCLKVNRARTAFSVDAQNDQVVGLTEVLIKNAALWTGDPDQESPESSDILLKDGKIAEVNPAGTVHYKSRAGLVEVDAKGAHVTPGLVDIHSHIGVYSWPDTWGLSDGNEMTHPITPYVRAMDALKPDNLEVERMRKGGVTTALVLPGSGNAMGGEGIVVKPVSTHDVRRMFVKAPRHVKMACGENPKRVYGNKNEMPMSRMGSAWVMRERFDKARKLIDAQQAFCALRIMNGGDAETASTGFPYDLALDQLVSLLLGDLLLQNHCYMVHDLAMILRLAKEFDFKVTAFHHALEAYKIADVLAEIEEERRPIVATFGSAWGFKMEGYDASVHSPHILTEKGVDVALKSDHPVIDAQKLITEAVKAHHFGLSRGRSIASVTSIAARGMGLGDRVGRIAPGFDADVVVWDADPLEAGSMPMRVLINGQEWSTTSDADTREPSTDVMPSPSKVPQDAECKSVTRTERTKFAIVNAASIVTNNGAPIAGPATLVVEDGTVVCVDESAACAGSVGPNDTVLDLKGKGAIIPGMIESGTNLGLVEMPSEARGTDGRLPSPGDQGQYAHVQARDGFVPNTRHTEVAYLAGVTTTVSPPLGSQMISGQSVHAPLCCGDTIDQLDEFVYPVTQGVALHVSLGQHAKAGGMSSSVSGQVATLRSVFAAASNTVINQTLTGALPVAAHVNSVTEIAAIVRLQKEFGFKLILVGASEAPLITPDIVNVNTVVGVQINARQPPDSWQTQGAEVCGIKKLLANDVPVSLTTQDSEEARDLRFDLIQIARRCDIPAAQAIELVTVNVANAFGLKNEAGKIVVGGKAAFIAFDSSDPLTMATSIEAVGVGGEMQCHPQQPRYDPFRPTA